MQYDGLWKYVAIKERRGICEITTVSIAKWYD